MMVKKRKVKKTLKNGSAKIWKNNEFLDYAQVLIESGILSKGADTLFNSLNKWLQQHGLERVTKKSFNAQLKKLIWNQNRVALLSGFVRLGLDLEKVYDTLSFLPKDLVSKKARSLRGHSVKKDDLRVSSQAGIGRLMISEEVGSEKVIELPLTNPKNPFLIAVNSDNRFKIAVINGPHIGLEFNPVLEENVVRNAFFQAEKQKVDALLLTSGLIWLDVKKSSGELTTHRAMISGLNYDANVMDPNYVEEANRIRRDLPPDEVSFETLRERFQNLLAGWRKITTESNGKPIYSGNVYIIFGREEEAVIEAAAHAEVLYMTTVNRNRVMNERKGLETVLNHLIKENASPKEITELKNEVAVLLSIEKRMVQTNVSHEDRKRFVNIVRSYIIRQWQKAIPNCKVVSQGTSFLKVGNNLIEVHQDRQERANEMFLDKFLKKNAGQRGLEGTLADVVLLASAYSENTRFAVTERVNDGKRCSTYVWQLPVALDKHLLKRKLNRVIRTGSPLERLLRSDQFEPGVFHLGFVDGVWLPEVVPTNVLVNFQQKNGKKKKKRDGYIYIFVDSDNHFGHQWKEYFWNPETEQYLGLESAVMEIFRRNYLKKRKLLPLHGFIGLGDRTQGHHFASESQPHTRNYPYLDLERSFNKLCREAGKGSKEEALEKMSELRKQALDQIHIRGEHWLERQVKEVYASFLESNTDFFLGILKSSKKSNVRWRGVGEVLTGQPDSRDIGVISDISGNHFASTVDNESTEFFYADKLIDLLHAGQRNKAFSRNLLKQLVKAPTFGNLGIGWGTVSVSGGYEWGISLRHDPSKKSGQNGDPLRQAPKNVLQRGDFSRIFSNRRTIHLSGDIHRFGLIQAPKATVISCAAGTDTDPYGERGFSPNNIGNLVVGLPAGGPDQRPIRLIIFNHDFVRDYLLEPWDINWDSIFIDAV